MMMRKPCSRRIATSSAVAPVAQGTPNSLQAAAALGQSCDRVPEHGSRLNPPERRQTP
jgi:hypothetical protein